MGLKTHLRARIALLFVGFFGGGILFALNTKELGALAPLAFFPMIFGGAFLLPYAFGRSVPAACPKCGGAALPGKMQILYTCGTCHAESNALHALVEAPLAPAPAPGQVVPKPPMSGGLSIPKLMLVLGLGAIGAGAYLAADPLRLLIDGVSVQARVLAVSSREERTGDGKAYVLHTARIQYQSNATPRTLDHSWSTDFRRECGWRCYREGDRLRVVYLPGDPANARIHSPGELFFRAGVVGGAGLFLSILSLVFLRRERR